METPKPGQESRCEMNRSFASMHNDYLDPNKDEGPVLPKPKPPAWLRQCRLNSRRVFQEYSNGATDWGSVYRAIYKGTDCGASVTIQFHGQDDLVSNEDLSKFGQEAVAEKIRVQSIVEGVDEETEPADVDLRKMKSGQAARKAMWQAVELTEQRAAAIWDSTHGCCGCALLHGNVDPETGMDCHGRDGITPVHKDCKECGGQGIVI